MARVVELCGPPGVGKTTIYKELDIRWKKKYNWIPGHYLSPHPNLSIGYLKLFLYSLKQKLKGKEEGTFDKVRIEARNRFIAQYPDYIDVCWADIITNQKRGSNGLDLRMDKAGVLATTINKIQFVRESTTEKVAILEEGLIHLLDVINSCQDTAAIERLVKLMPLPDALVCIEVPVPENAKRLAGRGHVLSMHKALSTEQLTALIRQCQERRQTIYRFLKEEGVPVLLINGKDPAGENANKIIHFVENLSSCKSLV